jgi:hypothetical protein
VTKARDIGPSGSRSWREQLFKSERLAELGLKRFEDYFETPHWKQFRRAAFEDQRKRLGHNRCELRGERDVTLIVHHLTYERMGAELLSDVRIVCKPCHGDLSMAVAQALLRKSLIFARGVKSILTSAFGVHRSLHVASAHARANSATPGSRRRCLIGAGRERRRDQIPPARPARPQLFARRPLARRASRRSKSSSVTRGPPRARRRRAK